MLREYWYLYEVNPCANRISDDYPDAAQLLPIWVAMQDLDTDING